MLSDLPPPPVSGLLPSEGWLEKLADERRKWMVALYRARNYNRPVDERLQQAQEPSLTGPSSAQRIVVQAANFCRRCGSIVDVGLESTAAAGGGAFVAEHRSGCSSCENELHNRRAISSSSSTESRRFCRRCSLHRCHVYGSRQLGQVNAYTNPATPLRPRPSSDQSRRSSKASLSVGHSLSSAPTTGRNRASSHNHRQQERRRTSAPSPSVVADSRPATCKTFRTGAATQLRTSSRAGGTTGLRGGSKPDRRQSVSQEEPIRFPMEHGFCLRQTLGCWSRPPRRRHALGSTGMSNSPDTPPDQECTNRRGTVSGTCRSSVFSDRRVVFKERAFSDDSSSVFFSGRVSEEPATPEPYAGRSGRGDDREESVRAARENVKKQSDPTLLAANNSERARGEEIPGNTLRKQAGAEAAGNSSITGSGRASTNEVVVPPGDGGLPLVDAKWAEEIGTRDEQIRVLKQKLASLLLGGQPVAETVDLQVNKRPMSG